MNIKVEDVSQLAVGMKLTADGPSVPGYMEGHIFTVKKIHPDGTIDLSDFPVSKKREWLRKHGKLEE